MYIYLNDPRYFFLKPAGLMLANLALQKALCRTLVHLALDNELEITSL